jgi:serine protease Do
MNGLKVVGVVALAAGASVMTMVSAPQAAQAQPQVMRPFAGDALILRGPGSYIGASIRDIDSDAAARNTESGVVIEDVRPDGPAAAAGLRAGDVVVEFDGERVRSAQQFSRLVQETPPGRATRAIVMRDGKRTELSVTPEAGSGRDFRIDSDRIRDEIDRAFESARSFRIEPRGARGPLGAQVQELTPELATYFGAKDGVLIAAVNADSPAAHAGLRAGDVITAVNGATVGSSADLQRSIRTGSETQELTLTIVRDKKESSVAVRLDVRTRQRPARPLRPVRGAGV